MKEFKVVSGRSVATLEKRLNELQKEEGWEIKSTCCNNHPEFRNIYIFLERDVKKLDEDYRLKVIACDIIIDKGVNWANLFWYFSNKDASYETYAHDFKIDKDYVASEKLLPKSEFELLQRAYEMYKKEGDLSK